MLCHVISETCIRAGLWMLLKTLYVVAFTSNPYSSSKLFRGLTQLSVYLGLLSKLKLFWNFGLWGAIVLKISGEIQLISARQQPEILLLYCGQFVRSNFKFSLPEQQRAMILSRQLVGYSDLNRHIDRSHLNFLFHKECWLLLLLIWWLLKEPFVLWKMEIIYALSPRILRASWISLGMMVTRLAWMAHKLVSSKRPTR